MQIAVLPHHQMMSFYFKWWVFISFFITITKEKLLFSMINHKFRMAIHYPGYRVSEPSIAPEIIRRKGYFPLNNIIFGWTMLNNLLFMIHEWIFIELNDNETFGSEIDHETFQFSPRKGDTFISMVSHKYQFTSGQQFHRFRQKNNEFGTCSHYFFVWINLALGYMYLLIHRPRTLNHAWFSFLIFDSIMWMKSNLAFKLVRGLMKLRCFPSSEDENMFPVKEMKWKESILFHAIFNISKLNFWAKSVECVHYKIGIIAVHLKRTPTTINNKSIYRSFIIGVEN